MRQAAPWVARHSPCILRAKLRAEFARARALAPSQAAGDPIARRQKTINGVHSTASSTCAAAQGGSKGTYGPTPGPADRQEGWSFYLTKRELMISCPALYSFSGLGGAAGCRRGRMPWVARHRTCSLHAKLRAEFVRARALAPSQATGTPIAHRWVDVNQYH